jgi:hypothetical protein
VGKRRETALVTGDAVRLKIDAAGRECKQAASGDKARHDLPVQHAMLISVAACRGSFSPRRRASVLMILTDEFAAQVFLYTGH